MRGYGRHEVSLGKFLRALERPIDHRPYYMARDGSLRQVSYVRCSRKFVEKQRRAKNIQEPPAPRRSWADVQAAWHRRQELR